MKNQYSEFVKYFEKQEEIFVQRSGDSVYLTDGKVVLMLPQTNHKFFEIWLEFEKRISGS